MIEGMETFVGKRLKESAVIRKQSRPGGGYTILTRPDYYSGSIHINMFICFDDDRVITDFFGDKCFSIYRGLYNRRSNVYERRFTRRDIQFLRKFVRENTED